MNSKLKEENKSRFKLEVKSDLSLVQFCVMVLKKNLATLTFYREENPNRLWLCCKCFPIFAAFWSPNWNPLRHTINSTSFCETTLGELSEHKIKEHTVSSILSKSTPFPTITPTITKNLITNITLNLPIYNSLKSRNLS